PKAIDRDRVMGYAKGINSYPPNVFFETPTDRVKLDTSYGIMTLEKSIVEVLSRSPDQHLILILDPVYKLMAGHISDEYDVKKFQDNVDMLLQKYPMTVILIHHSRLSKHDAEGNIIDGGAEDVMGSSYWNNWVDTLVRVKLTNPHTGADEVSVQFELTRNAYTFLPSFDIKWSRGNLQPKITRIHKLDFDDISTKRLE
ncbi:hypothetical protein LCGC14_1851240, partial [marine sediment metagenome]